MKIQLLKEQIRHKKIGHKQRYWLEQLYNNGLLKVTPLTLEEYTELQGKMNGTNYEY